MIGRQFAVLAFAVDRSVVEEDTWEWGLLPLSLLLLALGLAVAAVGLVLSLL